MGALKAKLVNAGGALMRTLSPDRLVTPRGELFYISPDLNDYNRCALFAGRYERFELKLLKQFFAEDDTIIEIGANIGVVARYAFLKKLKNGGTYVCIEPNPNSRSALEANMRRAQALEPEKKFHILMAAVCGPERDGMAEDFAMRQNLNSGLTGQLMMSDNEMIIQVATRSLSSLMREYAPRGASLICDSEGGEIPMIYEDPQAFSGIRQILIELHEPNLTGRPETPEDMLTKLRELGFTVGGAVENCFYLTRAH